MEKRTRPVILFTSSHLGSRASVDRAFMLSSKPLVSRASGWTCRSCRASKTLLKPKARNYATHVQFRKSSQKLPSNPARTRFAPSPTGHLHLGSLRTALFNYLLAKATGGQFLLRIEDTDQKRTVAGAEERICRDLEWAGLQWNEGPEVGGPHGPYKQSQRTTIYKEHAEHLLAAGHAYRCFCTSERLNKLAEMRSKLGLPTDYDRTCLGIDSTESDHRVAQGEAHTVRLKVPDTYPRYEDLVYGRVGGAKEQGRKFIHGQASYEDPVLVKSDGLPTYHLANVVDDHLMKITHVIRAAEWMPSTPKHLFMYEAFGWEAPQFAHVGLLQDQTKQKLSKRHLDGDFRSFQQEGIFPEALTNFVALLGWSHNQTSDVMDLKKLISVFDLKFTKGNTIVNFQKLQYLQKEYAQQYTLKGGPGFDKMVDDVAACIKQKQLEPDWTDILDGRDARDYISRIMQAETSSYYSPEEFLKRNRNFFQGFEPGISVQESSISAAITEVIKQKLENIPRDGWNIHNINKELDTISKSIDLGDRVLEGGPDTQKYAKAKLNSYLRLQVMGSRPGPPMAVSMEILGQKTTVARLKRDE